MTDTDNILQRSVAERKQARRENWRLLLRRPGFIIGNVIAGFWVFCAFFGQRIAPYDPFDYRDTKQLSPNGEWVELAREFSE